MFVPAADLVARAEEALLLVAMVSLPVVLVAAIVGAIVAAFQASTQVQDPTLSQLPRLLAVIAALAIFGPWMARQIGAFAARVFGSG